MVEYGVDVLIAYVPLLLMTPSVVAVEHGAAAHAELSTQ